MKPDKKLTELYGEAVAIERNNNQILFHTQKFLMEISETQGIIRITLDPSTTEDEVMICIEESDPQDFGYEDSPYFDTEGFRDDLKQDWRSFTELRDEEFDLENETYYYEVRGGCFDEHRDIALPINVQLLNFLVKVNGLPYSKEAMDTIETLLSTNQSKELMKEYVGLTL